MSLFKKLFNSTKPAERKTETPQPANNNDPYSQIPWMTDKRRETLRICIESGFKPSNALPTDLRRIMRPASEIANRLHAIKVLVLWLMVPEENLPSEIITKFVELNDLEGSLTEEELDILRSSRDDEENRNAIGWKFENAWPLAWFFGYNEPEITGAMMTGEAMNEILVKHTCQLNEKISEWLVQQKPLSESDVMKMEDLFYCLHNAVRSAQMGRATVPEHFDPMLNGGVIHERRHALTWMLSAGTEWDDTDLST